MRLHTPSYPKDSPRKEMNFFDRAALVHRQNDSRGRRLKRLAYAYGERASEVRQEIHFQLGEKSMNTLPKVVSHPGKLVRFVVEWGGRPCYKKKLGYYCIGMHIRLLLLSLARSGYVLKRQLQAAEKPISTAECV